VFSPWYGRTQAAMQTQGSEKTLRKPAREIDVQPVPYFFCVRFFLAFFKF
jgi:hypothetical protein